MLLTSFFKTSLRVQAPLLRAAFSNGGTGKTNTWKDRDTAVEKDFFNKEDEKAMRKLLNKVRDTAAKVDPATHESETRKSQGELEELFKKHGVPSNSALLNDLVKWKYQ